MATPRTGLPTCRKKKNMRMKKQIILITSLVLGVSALAVNNEWDGSAGDNDWNTAANWNKDRVPDVSQPDVAIVRLQQNVNIQLNASPITNPQQLWLGANNGAGTQHTLTVGDATVNLGTTRIGYERSQWADAAGNGLLTINAGGSVTAGELELGRVDSAAGAGTAGAVTLNAGSMDVTTRAYIGRNAGGSGQVTVSGGLLTFSGTGNQFLGDGGAGTLTLDGGIVTMSSATLRMADDAGSSGTLNLLSGSLDAATLSMGNGTAGILIDEGYMKVDNNRNGLFSSLASAGSITVNGGLIDDSALASVYTSGANSYDTGAGIIKWGYDSTTNETAVWAVAVPEPATLGMIGAFGGGLLIVRRRFMM